MSVFGKNVTKRYLLWIFLHILIVIDIIFITIGIFYKLPENISLIFKYFDLCLCAVLLIEWFWVFYISKPRTLFLKQKSNWVDLIASIPFDALLPFFIPQANILRFLRLIKLLRVFALFKRFFDGIERFIKISNIDKIIGGVIFTILVFTLILFVYGPTYGLFDDFYFVVVTLTTVGYGDITPVTFNEKLISLFLIIAGIFVFSTITAAISSYFTDRLLNNNEESFDETFEEILDKKVNSELQSINNKLEEVHKENKELKQEINELKKLLK